MTDHGTPIDSGLSTPSTSVASGAPASGGTSTSGSAQTRRRILLACAAVGLWVLVSFAGTMLDPARAPLWTRSLMWSLLASLLVSPALLVAGPASRLGAAGGADANEADTSTASASTAEAGAVNSEGSISEGPTSEEAASEATPFVGKGAQLWPEPGDLRERADLRRKAAAFEQAAFQWAEEEQERSFGRAETDRLTAAA